MQDPSVAKLFEEQLDYYAKKDQSAATSPIIPLFLAWARKKSAKGRSASGGKKIKIAEFGGAAGQLLAQIHHSFPQSELTNIELIASYRNRQILKKINFVHGSILDSKLADKSFDCLIIRDILHHLIGKNYQETLNNQEKALKELWRPLKPDGAIFIEELVDESSLGSKLIYYLSKINARIGLRIKSLEVTPNSIVFFLTPKKLESMIKNICSNNIKIKKYHRDYDWRQRIAHLGSSSGKMTIVIEKSSN